MTTEQTKALIRAEPFAPFEIPMADGRSLDVDRPEWVAYSGGRIAVVMRPDETFEVADLLPVPSLETKPRAARTG